MNTSLFFYVLIALSIIMASVYYFIIAPHERRSHARKLAILQQKIKLHEEERPTGEHAAPKSDSADDAVQ